MDDKTYNLYKNNKAELLDIACDLIDRAPTPDYLLFGFETKEDEEEYKKKLNEYLELEKPKIREKLKGLGFDDI